MDLAPEDTLDAYKTALAYGSDIVEGDVRRTKDGVFVLLHDATVGRTTGTKGTPEDRKVSEMSFADVKRLNAAEYGDFKLSAPPNPKQTYNPARIPSLDAALRLADAAGVGMDLDLKEDVVGFEPEIASFVARYPRVFAQTFFEAYPNAVLQMRAVQPDVNVMYNILGSPGGPQEPPGFLYNLTQPPYGYRFFGSELEKFTAERVAEIHDGCALAVPHSYDEKDEVEQMRLGLARGTDGAQTNSAEVAAATYGRPVATRIDLLSAGKHLEACLRNANNGYGLPYKVVKVDTSVSVLTLRDGCVLLPSSVDFGTRVSFAGDSATLASEIRRTSRAPAVPRARCADRRPPRSRIARRGLRASRKRLRLRGTAFDLGCAGGSERDWNPGGVERVEVSIIRIDRRGRCRHLGRAGRLGRRRSCRQRRWLPAAGVGQWRFERRRRGRLPAGRYAATARAIDVAGNVERSKRRRGIRFRVR